MNTILLAIALSTVSPIASKAVMTTPAGQTLECGAPRALETDSRQTVRVCEPKKR